MGGELFIVEYAVCVCVSTMTCDVDDDLTAGTQAPPYLDFDCCTPVSNLKISALFADFF